jgi:hypothetical protein
MQTITLQAHTGADGVLKLEVPVGIADVTFDGEYERTATTA